VGQNSQHRYDYSYFDDGRLSQLRDLDDWTGQPSQGTFHYMSRVYAYDQSARTTSVQKLPNVNPPAPFTGNYGYDAFNNMNNRSGQYALNQPQSDNSSYSNNRRVGWTYDEDGRVKGSADSATSSTRTWIYNAAGEMVSVAETSAGTTKTDAMAYDGDGYLLYESVTSSSTATTDYLIRSRVLGSALTKLDAAGNQITTYVPANGLVLPLQQNYQGNLTMSWVHRDALGMQEDGKAYDPFGALISNVQPPTSGSPPNIPFYGATYGGASWSSFADANNLSNGCMAASGNPADCDFVSHQGMTDDFWSNLPGVYDDLERGLSGHLTRVFTKFAEADQKNAPGGTTSPPHELEHGSGADAATGGLEVTDDGTLDDDGNPADSGEVDLKNKILTIRTTFLIGPQKRSDSPINTDPDAFKKKPVDGFTDEERDIAIQSRSEAAQIINSNADCQNFFKEKGLLATNEPGDVLKKISLIRGDRNHRGDIAETWPALGSVSMIILYNPFFTKDVGGTTTQFSKPLSTSESRALTMLHELAHAVWRNFHGLAPFQMSSNELDEALFQRCFHGGHEPLPKGVAD
jgi:hypothetical protein